MTYYFGRIFRVPEVFMDYRLLQTVLFLTDSVFRVLFAYLMHLWLVLSGMNHRELEIQ